MIHTLLFKIVASACAGLMMLILIAAYLLRREGRIIDHKQSSNGITKPDIKIQSSVKPYGWDGEDEKKCNEWLKYLYNSKLTSNN